MAPNLFISLTILIADNTISLRKKDCESKNGTYNYEIGACFVSHSLSNCSTQSCIMKRLTKGINDAVIYTFGIVGNICSIICLLLLLITYTVFKEMRNLGGKNIMCLASALLVSQILQLSSHFSKTLPILCVVIAIFLHWSLLLAFAWMVIFAFDLCLTIKQGVKLESRQKKIRFYIYVGLSLGVSSLITSICMGLHFSEKNFVGYGENNVCFVTRFWANLITFVIPVAFALVCNVIMLGLTIKSIHTTQKQVKNTMKKSGKSTKQNLHLTLMALKVSILVGLGWIVGFAASLLNSPSLTYIFTILSTFQGAFVFIAFVCKRQVWKLYQKRFKFGVHGQGSYSVSTTTTRMSRSMTVESTINI